MRPYRLRDGLSYCLIDGHPLFLDTAADRYFRLSGDTERAFISYIERPTPDAAKRLVDRNILAEGPPDPVSTGAVVPSAEASALEQPFPSASCGPRMAVEVLATVFRTRHRLGTQRLQSILDDLAAFRRHAATRTTTTDDDALVRHAQAFLQVRRLVPIETCCLPDSIAMVTFLARRHLQAHIVFGVTRDPFSAHCWAQSGGLVLNDTLGNTRSYAVIRVV